MTQVTARFRNRLQDSVINWQERRYQKDEFRQQQADIHRARMTCSASLRSFQQSQDWTGGLKAMSASGRHPVIEEALPKKRLFSEDGIRWDAAVAILVLIAVLLTGILASDLISIGANGRVISRLNSSIRDLEEKNEQVRTDIETNASSASIRTEAVKLNLIASGGATTIKVTAPINAQLTLSTAAKAAENAELEVRMTSYAGD